jgi:hypothetical protein
MVGVTCLGLLLIFSGCTGGTESKAAMEQQAGADAVETAGEVDPRRALESIHTSIPIYHGADYRSDLSRRDEMMVRSRYGSDAEVYTLATNDSFPQVYHYYTTYLAQFRGFPAQSTYPRQTSDRSLEVKLNEAMQDPFIPGASLDPDGKQITLQIAETEAEPRTVIRYIVTPQPAAPVATASKTTAGELAR